MDNNKAKRGIARDTIIYIPAKIIEGVIGILTLSLYTHIFDPAILGLNTTITITINIATFILVGWITQSSFRYINEYEQNKKLHEIYSTNVIALIVINIVVISLNTIGAALMSPDNNIATIFLLSNIMFAAFNMAQTSISVISSLRKIKLNLILSICSAILKLLSTAVISKYIFNDIKAILLSNIVIDFTVVFITIIVLKLYKYVRIKNFSMKLLKLFMAYGFPIAITSVTMWFLNVSDRYIIRLFYSNYEVGIYTTSYSIASAAFTLIMTGVMRGVYPVILKQWKGNNINPTEELLSQGAKYFILVAAPAAIGLSLLSKPIVHLLFDNKYWEGYSVISWVSIGMLFYGLTEYCNKAWELTGKTKAIFQNSLCAAIFNVTLNLIMIKFIGYLSAATVTFISYVFYFLLAYFRSRKILKWNLSKKSYIKIAVSLGCMSTFLILCNILINYKLINLVLIIIIAATIYLTTLIVTKELKEEIGYIFELIKAKRS